MSAQTRNSNEIVHAVVTGIDENYLYAQSKPEWEQQKKFLLAGPYQGQEEAFAAIRKALAILHDPELHLLTSQQLEAMQKETSGAELGVGLIDFGIDMAPGGEARVVTATSGSPAAKAGLKPGDIIVSVDGRQTIEMDHEAVLDSFRQSGPDGVKLEVRRGQRKLTVQLKRSTAPLKAVTFAEKHVGEKTVGYIRLAQFTPDAVKGVREAVTSLENSGVSAYVLDVRNNPGGLLTATREIASLFVSGKLGTSVNRKGEKQAIDSAGPPVTNKPLVVLVNHGTASAAELLSSGLQGLRRAQLVGEPTYGRGQVQNFIPLGDGVGLVVPSSHLLTPAGKMFKGKGNTPDVLVPQIQLPEDEWTSSRDRQFVRAATMTIQRVRPLPPLSTAK